MLRVLVLALVLGCASRSLAQAAPAAPATQEQAERRAQLAALDAYLADVQRPSRAHRGVWIAVLAALGAAQLTLGLLEDDPAQRTAYYAGFGLSAGGVVVLTFVPAPGRYASERFRAMPEGTRREQLAKITAGQYWLAREARVTARSTSWWVHLIGVGVSAGLFLGLGLGYEDNWARATMSGVGSLAVIELRIWTRKRSSVRYDERYRAEPTAPPRLTLGPGRLHLAF